MTYLILIIIWLLVFRYVLPRDRFWGFVVFLLPMTPLYMDAYQTRSDMLDFYYSAALYTGLGCMAGLFVFFLMGVPEMIRGKD